MSEPTPDSRKNALAYSALPAIFVFFWSTGFTAGKQGLQDAAPFTFLFYRFLIVAAVLTLLALAARAVRFHRQADP